MTEPPLTDFVSIIVSAGSTEEAHRIARALIDGRLAACVQHLPITSVYRWDDAIEEADEILLLVKARAADFDTIESAIRALHSYEVPEVIALPVLRGSSPYLAWLADATER